MKNLIILIFATLVFSACVRPYKNTDKGCGLCQNHNIGVRDSIMGGYVVGEVTLISNCYKQWEELDKTRMDSLLSSLGFEEIYSIKKATHYTKVLTSTYLEPVGGNHPREYKLVYAWVDGEPSKFSSRNNGFVFAPIKEAIEIYGNQWGSYLTSTKYSDRLLVMPFQ